LNFPAKGHAPKLFKGNFDLSIFFDQNQDLGLGTNVSATFHALPYVLGGYHGATRIRPTHDGSGRGPRQET
jgi:hypothetical protein